MNVTPAPMRDASKNVEHQGTGSQNTCGGDDGRAPRELRRHAKGRCANKPKTPDLRQPQGGTNAHTTGAAKHDTARNTASSAARGPSQGD